MSESRGGWTAEHAKVDVTAGAVHLDVDESLYPLDAVYAAAFGFIDRCWVLLDRPAAHKVRVQLAPKSPGATDEVLRSWAGELANELLACAWRQKITEQNRAVVEAVTMQAIAGAMGPPSLDDLAKFDFSQDALEDPLGIATSWEEKYRKGAKGERTE